MMNNNSKNSKNWFIIATWAVVLILFSKCGDEDAQTRFIKINGFKYTLEKAYYQQIPNDGNLGYSRWALKFQTKDQNPSVYLIFVIYSPNTERIEEGYYTYQYQPSNESISFVSFGKDLRYNNYGEVISGLEITESKAEIEGSISVDFLNGEYDFTFDLTANYNDEVYLLTGEYNEELKSEDVTY